MPCIEDDEGADAGYIEYRTKELIWRFDTFLKHIMYKYSTKFNNNIKYPQKAAPPDRISWFNNVGFIPLLVEYLNQYFNEITGLKLFDIQKRLNGQSWNEFFHDEANKIMNSVNNLASGIEELRKYLCTQEVHTFLTYHEENIAMCRKIESCISKVKFDLLTENFMSSLSNEFKRNFSVKTAESTDLILYSIDSWYNENKIPIPENNGDNGITTNKYTKNDSYFVYEEK
jgi:hypothetical protein